MQVSIEQTSDLERKMTLKVPSEDVEAKVDSRLGEVARNARIPGFRPGKVPMREVRRRFGSDARQEVAGELMQNSFAEAVSEDEALQPAGQPEIETVTLERGKDLEFVATFEVFPEIALADTNGVRVERPSASVTEADVERTIERLREQHKSYEERPDRAGEQGDQVTVDFEGHIDGEPFEGGSGENREIVLGSGQMIADFERQLEGLRPGERSTFEVAFPEDYSNEALRGCGATFDVSVKTVAEPVWPELDEEFFARFGVEEGGYEAFRDEVRANLERELANAVKTQVKNQIMDALVEMHTFELPEAMVQEEIGRMKRETVQRIGGGGLDPDALPGELFREQAERRCRLQLVLAKLVEQESLEADEARVRTLVEEIAAPYQDPQQVIAYYYQSEEQMNEVRGAALEERVIEHLLQSADVREVERTFEQITSGSPDAAHEHDAEASEHTNQPADDDE